MREVVLDTNALIDLMNLSCWEALADLPGFRFWIVENVREEVTREDQRKALEGALASGLIGETKVGEGEACGMEELATYARLKGILGDGEAAGLAVAHHRGWIFVSYEKGRLRREAGAMLGERFWSTPLLLATMAQAGICTFEHMETAIASLGSGSSKTQHLSRLVAEARSLPASENA
jgi:hypothetical protein